MIILGVTHPISWNNAACILVDGQLVAMAEEERFNRIKHAPRMAPTLAIEFCLQEANVTLADVDYVAIGFDTALDTATQNITKLRNIAGVRNAAQWFYQISTYGRTLPLEGIPAERIVYVNHHQAHAASAFFASGFEEANILSLDGSGGSESGILAVGRGAQIEVLKTVSNGGSWGLMYELITEIIGFRRHSGEGKTMGLAAYSTPDPAGLPFIDWDADIPTIDPAKRKKYISELANGKELSWEERQKLAATTQASLERAGSRMSEWLYEQTGIRNLCLAGGSALNCSMNGILAKLPWVDNIFIQPAAHDAGTALGAALQVFTEKTGRRPQWEMLHAYWGAEYDNEEIQHALQECPAISYHLSDNIFAETAQLLAEDKIVGWFQGRFEVGPRALGNRSILANPANPDMKDLINKKVKGREPWRPFAPSILAEEIGRYIDDPVPSRFMILAFQTRPETMDEIVSAVHVDGTCRPQTVHQETNPRYWELIKAFMERTGIPAVLNTSFNVDSQPIVNTPAEAIDTFLNSGLDILAIGDFIATKNK
ncbi:MAG: carbamoyltransferase C-terminal domain-containing protein [Caldilineaceae bacterium]